VTAIQFAVDDAALAVPVPADVTVAATAADATGSADSDAAAGELLTGFRIDRLELRNWGTFHDRVWSLQVGGRNGLLTGDIGSGKSTVVDAITTLLLPANRISYNKAAGAQTKERSLRSYVLGYYKSERNEITGTSRPVPLRNASSYSVVLGVFANPGYGSQITLAQVFWMKDGGAGQPERFFVVADRAMSVVADFSGFGSDIMVLKRRLRTAGARIHDHFPEYGKDFRRRLGIESEQAMELFHQTVSMKSVGDLTDFVRSHMLEPFDAASWTERIVAHFEDLTKAHEAVRRAQAQLAALEPLLAECGSHDSMDTAITAMSGQRSALRYYFAERKADLLDQQITSLDEARTGQQAAQERLKTAAAELRERETRLKVERAGHGGDQLTEIERRISDDGLACNQRVAKAERFGELLASAGMDPAETPEQFAARRSEITRAVQEAGQERADCQNQLTETAVEKKTLLGEAAELNAELTSLRSRKSNIPMRSLRLREWICGELDLTETDLPFAGELIAVRPEELAWEGAAERLLHSFAMSILVPQERYPAVSDWINDHHLNAKCVYYRVPADTVPPPSQGHDTPGNTLAAKLEIKDSAFYPWLDRELAIRAGHVCVPTMAEFRRMPRAITRAGQIKGGGGRHEKNDATRIDDRSLYVLGWSNERKIKALVARAETVQRLLNQVAEVEKEQRAALEASIGRGNVLAGLAETTEFAEIDWQSLVNRIERLKAEKQRLEQASQELERLNRELEAVQKDAAAVADEADSVSHRIGSLQSRLDTASQDLAEARGTLAEPACESARDHFAGIAGLLAARPAGPQPAAGTLAGLVLVAPADCDRAQATGHIELTATIDKLLARKHSLGLRIAAKMAEFRRQYPVETTDFDDSVHAASGYRELHQRLVDDDLPRFQEQFKTYLNTNTIRDIASFQSQLNKQGELIRDRVATINGSLIAVDYNPGRFIRLEASPTPNTEVRDFITELRACTDDSLSLEVSDQYNEQKFIQVSRIIQRFRGREGQTEADRAWTRRVADVRNWFTFSASERWREDDIEYENYTDSGGKSGGQKEKLAYTILAASLAYQFKLEWGEGRSRRFRFVVIDEAFGRGSDESTRFALELFRKLGLQLLIVTPLQKIHVIEPYVSAVGFVDNPTQSYSRLQTLTITEYRNQRRAHVDGTALTTSSAGIDLAGLRGAQLPEAGPTTAELSGVGLAGG
jgi:uncharacterized protein YPO0396